MKMKLFSSIVICLVLIPAVAIGDPLPTTAPESIGLSSTRLQVLTERLKADIDKGMIPGVVLMISRHGKIGYFEAMGSLDPEKKTAMTKDAIFRIYSMTKPITTVTAMMLFEDGKITLDLVAPLRPMTIQDLMRHSAGLTYGFFGEGAVKKLYREANLNEGDPTTEEFVERLAKLPLVYHPGTTWDYSQATDVLGRVIEVVTGKSLYAAVKEMLLDPLGMTDTSFYATDASKHARIAEPLANDRAIGAGAQVNDPRIVRKYESGGGGMLSTAIDYARFLQMLLNGGTLEGKRYLGPRTIAYMTSDQMGDVVRRGPFDLLGPGVKFGLGFAVRTEPGVAPYAGSAGDFFWGGAGGTAFWVDHKEKMFVVYMMQAPSKRLQYRTLLR